MWKEIGERRAREEERDSHSQCQHSGICFANLSHEGSLESHMVSLNLTHAEVVHEKICLNRISASQSEEIPLGEAIQTHNSAALFQF